MFNTTFGYQSPYGFGQLTLPQNPFSQGSSQPTPTQTVPLSGSSGGGTTPYLKQDFKGRANSITQKLNKAGITDQGVNQIANFVTQGADIAQGALENGVINSKGYDTFKQIGNMKTGNAVIDAGKAIAMTGISAINRWGGQESDEFYVDRQLQETMGGSYADSFKDLNEAEQGNGFYGMFSLGKKKKQDANVAKQEEVQAQLQDINEEAQAQYAAANNVQANNIKYLNKINGIDFSEFSLVAKNGIKLKHLGRIKNLNLKNRINVNKKSIEYTETEPIDKFKEGGVIDFNPIIYSYTDPIETDVEFIPVISEEVSIFKDGGKTEKTELVKLEETNQKNIIPEGALHKNKHHIENTEGLTQKGIPVIDNDGEQQAEIELDEIIFTLEVTKKLEELHKIYKEGTNKERDNAAIEAGKLLVQEILYNTDDRTGLISKCKEGGKING